MQNNDELVGDPFAEAKARLLPLIRRWASVMKEIGTLLKELQPTLGATNIRALMKWAADNTGLTMAMQEVWLRVAQGETGLETLALKSHVSSSILSHMSADTVELLASGQLFAIASPSEGKRVEKSVCDMTPAEVRAFVRAQGVLPADAESAPTPFRDVHPTEYMLSKDRRKIFELCPGGGSVRIVADVDTILALLRPEPEAGQAADHAEGPEEAADAA